MLERPIAAFDIETIPDPAYGRRVDGLSGDDATVIRTMVAQRLEETKGRTAYPAPPLHRVVAVSVAWLDPAKNRFAIKALGDGAWDEPSQLRAFAKLLDHDPAPRLVSWNGNGFDLPILRYRSMLHRIAMPGLYRSAGPWRWNNYENRYHDMHLDLMDVLSGYGASRRVGLAMLGDLLAFPNKAFLEHDVYEHLLRGEDELIRTYCKLDVVTTLLGFLRWCLHRGELSHHDEDRLVGLVATELARQSDADWSEIVAALGHRPEAA